jgi:hypothetical protein
MACDTEGRAAAPTDAERDEIHALARQMWDGSYTEYFAINDVMFDRFHREHADLIAAVEEEGTNIGECPDDYFQVDYQWGMAEELQERLRAATRQVFGRPHRLTVYVGGGNYWADVDLDNLTWENEVTGEEGGLAELRYRVSAPFANRMGDLECIILDHSLGHLNDVPAVVPLMVKFLLGLGRAPAAAQVGEGA